MSRGCTLAELVESLIQQLDATDMPADPFLGMFADEPALVDEVVEAAMKTREEHRLRSSRG
jgi:hypothetical protein